MKMATSMAEGSTIFDLAFPVLDIAKQKIRDERKGDGTVVNSNVGESIQLNTEGNVEIDLSVASERERDAIDEENVDHTVEPRHIFENISLTSAKPNELLYSQCVSSSINVYSEIHNPPEFSASGQESLFVPRHGLVNADDGNSTGPCMRYVQTGSTNDMTYCDNRYHAGNQQMTDLQNSQIFYSANQYTDPYTPMNYQNYPQVPYVQQCYPVCNQYHNVKEQGFYIPNQELQVQEFNNLSQNVWSPLNPKETVPLVANSLCVENQTMFHEQNIAQAQAGKQTPNIPQAWSQGTPNALSNIDESEIREIKDKLKESNLVTCRKVTVETNQNPPTSCIVTVAPSNKHIAPVQNNSIRELNLAPLSFYQNVPPPSMTVVATVCPEVVSQVTSAAVVTKPSGDKVYIPLDHNLYELKHRGHELDEMHDTSVENAFKKESELYGNGDLGCSPRPIQLKGSISDEDVSETDYTTDASRSSTSISTRASETNDLNEFREDKVTDVDEGHATDKEEIEATNDNKDQIQITGGIEEKGFPETGSSENLTADIESHDIFEIEDKIDETKLDKVIPEISEPSIATNTENTHTLAVEMQVTSITLDTENGDNSDVGLQASHSPTNIKNADASTTETQVSAVEENSISFMDYTGTIPSLPTLPEQQFYEMHAVPENMAWNEPQSTQSTQWHAQSQDGSYASQHTESPIGEFYHFNDAWYQPTYMEQNSDNVINFGDAQNTPQGETDGDEHRSVYPALHVSDDGLVTVILRHGVYLEMTTDKALRLVCHDRKLVVAMNADGSSACLIHPAAKVFQSGTTVDADLYLARKVKIMTEYTVFANNFNTYVFDYTMIEKIESFSEYTDQSEDRSIEFLVTDTGFFNFEVALKTSEIVSRAYFEAYQNIGCKVIVNGVKIVQNDSGEVSVYSGPIRFLRLSPMKSVLRLKSQFLEADIETNWNVKLRRGTHTLNASYLGLILSNGKIKACIDQKNKLQAFVLPDHHRLYLGQRLLQQRPGVPRQRYINLPQRRGEPEGDHWGYARHQY